MILEQTTYRQAQDDHDREEAILMLARPALEHVAHLLAIANSEHHQQEAAGALILIERTIHDARSELDVGE